MLGVDYFRGKSHGMGRREEMLRYETQHHSEQRKFLTLGILEGRGEGGPELSEKGCEFREQRPPGL